MLYTFYDTETSGLERGSDIWSFSYMLSDERLNVKRAETLYLWKEGVTQWSEEASQINGLTREFLRQHEAEYETNLKKMYIVLSYADLVGYNAGWVGSDGIIHGFDYAMCTNFLGRNGYPIPIPRSHTDVMKLYMNMHHGQRRKLVQVFKEYDIDPMLASAMSNIYFHEDGGAHSSSYDVCMTALIYSKMILAGDEVQASNKVDMSVSMEEDETQYLLYLGDGILMLRITDGNGDSRDTSLDEFKKENASMCAIILKNPEKYMEV